MGFLTDITEWGWPQAPPRKLVFRDDNPKLPHTLPRYLPVDVDRRLTAVLAERPGNELAAAALRLQRSRRTANRGATRPGTGLRARPARPWQLAEDPAREAGDRADGPDR
jgi:hypothetical protein